MTCLAVSFKQLAPPAVVSQSKPPSKLALQSQSAASQKDDVLSHKEGSSGSSPRSEGPSISLFCAASSSRSSRLSVASGEPDTKWYFERPHWSPVYIGRCTGRDVDE